MTTWEHCAGLPEAEAAAEIDMPGCTAVRVASVRLRRERRVRQHDPDERRNLLHRTLVLLDRQGRSCQSYRGMDAVEMLRHCFEKLFDVARRPGLDRQDERSDRYVVHLGQRSGNGAGQRYALVLRRPEHRLVLRLQQRAFREAGPSMSCDEQPRYLDALVYLIGTPVRASHESQEALRFHVGSARCRGHLHDELGVGSADRDGHLRGGSSVRRERTGCRDGEDLPLHGSDVRKWRRSVRVAPLRVVSCRTCHVANASNAMCMSCCSSPEPLTAKWWAASAPWTSSDGR